MPNVSLQKKIIIAIAVAIFVFGGIATLFVYTETRGALIAIQQNDLKAANVGQAYEISQIFDNSQRIVESLAERGEIIKYLTGDPRPQDKDILAILEHYNIGRIFSAVYVLNTDGTALVSTDESFVGQDYSFRGYFKKALAGSPAAEMNIGVTSGQAGYYFSYFVQAPGGAILGVAVVKLIPDLVQKPLQRGPFTAEETAERENVMLADDDGMVIFSNVADRIYKSLGRLSEEKLKKIADERRFPGITVAPLSYDQVLGIVFNYTAPETLEFLDAQDNRREIVTVVQIDDYPFFLILEVSTSRLFAAAFRVAGILAIVVIFAAALSALIIFFLVARFLKPLDQLKEISSAISRGHFEQRVKISTGDELEELANAFNEMAAKLKAYYANLDAEVKIKTKELSQKLELIEEQNATLDETKRAMLNLLEDLDTEKSEIQEAHAKDEAMLQSIGDGLMVVDKAGKIILVNRVAEKMLGWPTGELLGRPLAEAVVFEDEKEKIIPVERRPVVAVLASGEDYATTIFAPNYYHRKDGTKFPVTMFVTPVRLNGEIIGAINNFQDVTEIMKIEKTKNEFISVASHQLRTPPSSIAWQVEMLLSERIGKLNEKQKKYLADIYRINHRMIELINATLNVSRIELGTLAIEPELVDLAKVADSVIGDFAEQIEGKKLLIGKDYDKDLSPISLDPRLTQIIFQNLISNAIKYTPEKGSVNIAIRRKKTDVLIEISDTGYGIPESQQTKVFTKFFRGDNIKEKDPDGTGLGLYIVKSIAEQFGGKIWFASKENEGTTFYVSIPLEGVKKKEGSKTLAMTP